jgi:toxin ParE1/3/4
MAKYKLSIEAQEDLIRIYQYGLRTFGEKQADRYFENFFECFETITQRPFSYESVEYLRTGYRRCVCGSDSIFFRVIDGNVEIMAIVGKQDLNSLLKLD